MHSRQTVIYICEEYPSGNRYYYKRELITHDSWMNPKSLEWSAPRPISEKTFYERARAGYRTEYRKINKPVAKVYQFPPQDNRCFPFYPRMRWR